MHDVVRIADVQDGEYPGFVEWLRQQAQDGEAVWNAPRPLLGEAYGQEHGAMYPRAPFRHGRFYVATNDHEWIRRNLENDAYQVQLVSREQAIERFATGFYEGYQDADVAVLQEALEGGDAWIRSVLAHHEWPWPPEWGMPTLAEFSRYYSEAQRKA